MTAWLVTFDLEYDGFAIPDIDDPGILAWSANHARPGGRKRLEPFCGKIVGAMLAPHHREDAEFG